MTELRAAIEHGTIEEILGIVARFHFLPEYTAGRLHQEVINLAGEAERLEARAAQLRDTCRDRAGRLLEGVRRDWPDDEIAVATGYDNKDRSAPR